MYVHTHTQNNPSIPITPVNLSLSILKVNNSFGGQKDHFTCKKLMQLTDRHNISAVGAPFFLLSQSACAWLGRLHFYGYHCLKIPKHIFYGFQRESITLVIEPFYGGSHKQLVDLLLDKIPGCSKACMSAKKWHWRMRTSALYFATTIPLDHQFK